MVEVRLAHVLHQPVAHQVDEVRRLARIDVHGPQVQRLSLGPYRFFLSDLSRLHHGVEHHVAAGNHPVRMAIGIEITWVLDHAGEHRALRQVQILHVFAEISLRRLAKAVDGEASLLPQRDLVGIDLKDLLLVEAILQLESDGNFDDLALQPLLRCQEEAARQLHGERGSALPPPAQPQIVAQRPQQAEVVDPAVIKETPVLDRSYGIDQIGWQFVKADQAALGAVLPFGEPGDQLLAPAHKRPAPGRRRRKSG